MRGLTVSISHYDHQATGEELGCATCIIYRAIKALDTSMVITQTNGQHKNLLDNEQRSALGGKTLRETAPSEVMWVLSKR